MKHPRQKTQNARMHFSKGLLFIFLSTFFIFHPQTSFSETATPATPEEKPKAPTGRRIPMFGRDFGPISRVVIDGVPEGGYVPRAGNRALRIELNNLKGYLDVNDLPPKGAATRLEKASIDVKDDKKTVLNLDYNCDCQADVYIQQGRKLVIDIYSNNAAMNPSKVTKKDPNFVNPDRATVPPQEPIETAVNPNHVDTGGHAMGTKDQQFGESGGRQMGTSAGAFSGMQTSAGGFSKVDGLKAEEKPKQAEATSPAKTALMGEDINPQMKEQLVALLKGASDQGVEFDPKKATDKVATIDMGQMNKNIVPSAITPQDENFAQSLKGCLDDGLLSFSSLETQSDESVSEKQSAEKPKEDEFSNKVASLMAKIAEKPNEYNQEASLELAEYYVAHGMGQEALVTIQSFGVPDQRGQVIQALAHLFADEVPPADTVIMQGEKCQGLHGLWAAYTDLKRGYAKKAAEVAKAGQFENVMEKLPKPLVQKVGIPLVTAMIQNKNIPQAEKLTDRIAELTDQFSPEVMLVRGMIDYASGRSQKAMNTLEETVGNNGLENPDPRLMLISLKQSYNQDLTRSDRVFLEELAFLRPKLKEGAEAVALISEDLARQNNFQEAFKRLSESAYRQEPSENPVYQKANDLFKRMAVAGEGDKNGTDMVVYSDYPQLIEFDPKTMWSYGKRLLSLGYSNSAVKVFKQISDNDPEFAKNIDVAIPYAQALRQVGLKQTAVDVLAGYNDADAIMQRSQIFADMGRYDEAVDILRGMETSEGQKMKAQYSWNSQNWPVAVEQYKKLYSSDPTVTNERRLKAASFMNNQAKNSPATQTTASGSPEESGHPENLELLLKQSNELIDTYKAEFPNG